MNRRFEAIRKSLARYENRFFLRIDSRESMRVNRPPFALQITGPSKTLPKGVYGLSTHRDIEQSFPLWQATGSPASYHLSLCMHYCVEPLST